MAERLITDSSLARATATSYCRAHAKHTREDELSLRAEGLFDAADMLRQFADGLDRGVVPDDQVWADRGRTSALIQVLGGVPVGLRVYTEAGVRISEPEVIGEAFDFPIADFDRSKSPPAVAALADFATELSEEDCCACWLINQAFYLWAGGFDGTTDAERSELQRLHDEAGGWLHWFHDDEPDRFQGGLTFLPTAEWLPLFEAWAAKQSPKAEAVLRG